MYIVIQELREDFQRDDGPLSKLQKLYQGSAVLVLICLVTCSQPSDDYVRTQQRIIASCTQILEHNPQDSTALTDRAWAFYHLDKYQQALADCEKALALYPGNFFAYNIRGCTVHQLFGDSGVALALKDWRKAVELNPRAWGTIGNIGWAFAKQENWDSSIYYYDIAYAAMPHDTLVLFGRARVLDRLGLTDEALTNVSEAIRINPKDADALWLRGNMNYKRRSYDECREDYLRYLALEGDSADIEVHFFLGCALEELGLTSNAKEQFRRTIEKDPSWESGYAYIHLAGLLEDDGDLEPAISCYTAYLGVAPADDTAWTNYARERLVALSKL